MVIKRNPCDLCKHTRECYECVLCKTALQYECLNDECFLNYEGNCLCGFYENCGAWEGAEDGKRKAAD